MAPDSIPFPRQLGLPARVLSFLHCTSQQNKASVNSVFRALHSLCPWLLLALGRTRGSRPFFSRAYLRSGGWPHSQSPIPLGHHRHKVGLGSVVSLSRKRRLSQTGASFRLALSPWPAYGDEGGKRALRDQHSGGCLAMVDSSS